MKTVYKFSILINIALAGGLGFVWLHRPQLAPPLTAPVHLISPPPLAHAAATATLDSRPVTAAPFRWSQMSAADYHVYVKNLRAIGCPEASLRAIVSADVHAAYGIQVNALQKKLSDLANGSWSAQLGAFNAEADLKAQLENIPAQEAAKVDELLGLKPATVDLAAADSASSPAADDDQSQVETPSLPMVLVNVDPVALGLNDDQVKLIAKLRQSFVDQVGGVNQDPDDPAYLARWQQAQPQADAMLRGVMGNEIYTKYIMLQLKTQNQPAPSP